MYAEKRTTSAVEMRMKMSETYLISAYFFDFNCNYCLRGCGGSGGESCKFGNCVNVGCGVSTTGQIGEELGGGVGDRGGGSMQERTQ